MICSRFHVSFKRYDLHRTVYMIFLLPGQMDDPLVGTAAEVEFRVAEFGNERTVDEGVDVWEDLSHALVCEDFLVCESGVAPDVLAGLFLDAAGKFGEGLDLVERVAAGERDVGELIGLDHLQKFLDCHFPATHEIP